MNTRAEWIETDGLGGFASGTVGGLRTRRYHALLLHAATPPTGRRVLINGFDAWIDAPEGRFALSSQRYAPDVTHPDGGPRLVDFTSEPWPRWTYRLENGLEVAHELFVARGEAAVALSWSLLTPRPGITLTVRPFLSGRDTHSTHHENDAFRFDAELEDGGRVTWRPYDGLPAISSISNGVYEHDPAWYRNFQYDEERARGLDFLEDLASPGSFRCALDREEAFWIVSADNEAASALCRDSALAQCMERLRIVERERRGAFPTPLHRAADAYIVRRAEGRTIIAGYPWFSDWGRDTFIALRGLCILGGRVDDARDILLAWADTVSEGMLPNYFPESGQAPEYNSVDASLWYVIAVHELMHAMKGRRAGLSAEDRKKLRDAVLAILDGYARGTRFGIRADEDGLLFAGVPGVQLTWMDAKVGDWVVTPRIGKPVEVQALWINALRIGAELSLRWQPLYELARGSFAKRFWNEPGGYLNDVVDPNHELGTADASFRSNQILAMGGLPFQVFGETREERPLARRAMEQIEARLWTPLGPRSLAPGEPGYTGRYEGGVLQRDGAYHQGTVWPWLIGPFIEAWLNVRGGGEKAEARRRFVTPLMEHLEDAGVGHVSEIADAEAPHTARGCPFQAWSVGELLRLQEGVLAPRTKTRVPATRRANGARGAGQAAKAEG